MKWKHFQLAEDDLKAKAHVLENLATGAQAHTMSRKLLSRFRDSVGPMLLIAFESLDIDYPYLYKYALYSGGKFDPVGTEPFSWTDSPKWGLIELLERWLSTSCDALVLCENWLATRDAAMRGAADGSWESRPLCYGGSEVYHVLTNQDGDNPNLIEATIRESEYEYATGLCTRYAEPPRRDIPSEAFFDVVVANTEHIFVPALDGEGYLVWSPIG